MADEGFVQVPADSSGRRVEALAVTVPAGTVVTDYAGTKSTLTSDTVLFRQVTAIGDPSSPGSFASVSGEVGRGALWVNDENAAVLDRIDHTLTDIKYLLAAALQA